MFKVFTFFIFNYSSTYYCCSKIFRCLVSVKYFRKDCIFFNKTIDIFSYSILIKIYFIVFNFIVDCSSYELPEQERFLRICNFIKIKIFNSSSVLNPISCTNKKFLYSVFQGFLNHKRASF